MIYMTLCTSLLYNTTPIHCTPDPLHPPLQSTVSFHNFKSQNFKLSVSNPQGKYVAYSSVLYRISNCQSLGRKNKHEILKTCTPLCRVSQRPRGPGVGDPALPNAGDGRDTCIYMYIYIYIYIYSIIYIYIYIYYQYSLVFQLFILHEERQAPCSDA